MERIYEIQATALFDFWIMQKVCGIYFLDLLREEHRRDYAPFKEIVYN